MTDMAKGTEGAAGKRASKTGLIVLAVVLVAVIAGAAVAYHALAPTAMPDAASTAEGEGEQTEAPDFTMISAGGEELSLGSLRGKPVVLNFWASTCGPCKSEMPEFQTAFEEYGDQVQFVMLNVPDFNGETRERALRLVEQSAYTFPIYFDATAEAQVQYGVTSIPRTYFISADGILKAYASGIIDAASLDEGINMLL